jgi:hypothetical protein
MRAAPLACVARHLAFVLIGVGAVLTAIAGCTGTGSNPGTADRAAMTPDARGGAPTCALGAACSSTDLCAGGIAGCTSNCQCLNGTWQAPCSTDLPQTGSSCTPEGAECGYTTSTNECGADNCYCQGGAWNCQPSCAIGPENHSGALCAAAGGQCVFGGCSNPGPQACGSAGMFCCLSNVPTADAGPETGTDSATDSGPLDGGEE